MSIVTDAKLLLKSGRRGMGAIKGRLNSEDHFVASNKMIVDRLNSTATPYDVTSLTKINNSLQ
jgi:hypothetical protein